MYNSLCILAHFIYLYIHTYVCMYTQLKFTVSMSTFSLADGGTQGDATYILFPSPAFQSQISFLFPTGATAVQLRAHTAHGLFLWHPLNY